MPTNKLGLPLLTGNETADLPRDFNALAEKIDEKAGSPDGLAQLDGNGKTLITQLPDASTSQKGATKLNDTTNSTSTAEAATANAVKKVNDALVTHSAEKATTTKLGHVKPDGSTITVDTNGVISAAEMIASNVKLEDTAGNFTATNVEEALSELFINVSNGKTLVGGTITDVDPSVNIPAEPTFQDLATAIASMVSVEFIPGDDFFVIKDTPKEVTSTSFILAKKLKVLFDGEGRLRYEVNRGGSGQAFSRFYLNGVLIPELSQDPGYTGNMAFTKDMNFKYGDDIEIHSRVHSSGQKVFVENFTVSLKNTRSYFQKII
ncbi:phage tail protein [Pseudobacillus badius]|uniref:phage tail protein n=1 Tax=Bacillus badius TaxID=1455 RepID=UPI0024A29835|nr:phage tail protein [Bacillus badius]GLY11429.1 hypothetical protein Bbad01_26450 [Bacillus badius]